MSKVAGAQKFDGRNWFERQIAKRTQAALAAQDAVFAEQHAGDSLPELAAYVSRCAAQWNHAPAPCEIEGGSYIARRFGSWEAALAAAGLSSAYKIPRNEENRRYQKPVENPDDNQGGNKPDDTKGGPEDSGDHGDGTGGDDGDDGGTGGDHGSGGEEDDTPRIYTTLKTQQLTKTELPDGRLTFIAYPIGKGDLHIRVRLKNETNSGNGLLLTSPDNRNYEAQLDFNAGNRFVLSLYDGETFLGLVQYRVGYYADLADDDNPESGDYPPSIFTSLDEDSPDITSQSYNMWVTARTNDKLGGDYIFSRKRLPLCQKTQ